MAASAYDSFYFRDRYGAPAMRAIWDDRAMVQRWLDVEAALATTEQDQGKGEAFHPSCR
jgi:3-carboxy-cis,cis-muconate cycloisomerase